ncbi:hypothetical protein IVB16_27470 [Bradyrhizobium sp. 183]|uniref:hypothetical protein n=1 Tax=unclassified Bradyrhizobium TaxID=2631580 RepID=UPI0020004B03|nr:MULTISPECIES: hypothetical protein [unclassified Bradyrhizobium]UPJ78591.1 hypothetical protein IVB17_27470 [Bradyrhizobium sp. 184]UPJ86386.1 hypothetical protein IVB16_27470 [Bradyrhizobium sp. 183]
MTRSLPRKKSALVPVADWRVTVFQPQVLTRAGRFVARRYRLEPHVAEIIADLAGLGDQGERQ